MATVKHGPRLKLLEALIATADPRRWAQYCRLAVALTGSAAGVPPVYAVGSVEWRRQQDQPREQPQREPTAPEEAAGRQRLAKLGAPSPFAGAPSPLGVAGAAAFDEFIARHRGPPALLAEINAVEQKLVDAFVQDGCAGRYHAVGLAGGARKEIDPAWFGHMRLDFANNRVELADGSVITEIEVALAAAANAVASPGPRARPARIMLRDALVRLWERGSFTAGTGNERVLALVLRELGLSASDPPYGFKSAETIRKLRKQLGMSL